jgi:hypothetical protein
MPRGKPSGPFIEIRGTLEFKEPPAQDVAQRYLDQIAADAVYGTFEPYPKSIRNEWEHRPDDLAVARIIDGPNGKDYQFWLSLAVALFPPVPAGLQHLIGILAGDLFQMRMEGVGNVSSRITEVRLPDGYREDLQRTFRDRKGLPHRIGEIRSRFRLKKGEPLLAFSFKPRFGIKYDYLKKGDFRGLEGRVSSG